MEYVLVDKEGASRDYLDAAHDVGAALREAGGNAGDFYVLAYTDAGEQLGEAIRGDEWLLIGPIQHGTNKVATKTKTKIVASAETLTLGAGAEVRSEPQEAHA